MIWDLEKDVTYSDVGKAINKDPFGPLDEDYDRRLGTCDRCGRAVEASPVGKYRDPFIVGIFVEPIARENTRQRRNKRDEAIAQFEAMDKCVCFHEWGQKVTWIAQTPPMIAQTPRTIAEIFDAPFRKRATRIDWLRPAQFHTHWLFGQCRSCGKAVERQLPEGWSKRPPWQPRPLPDRPEAPSPEEAEPLHDSPGEQASSVDNALLPPSLGQEFPERFLESQAAWLTEEGVALDHDDEAIARYERLKAEKGSCECVDDDEPVDES